MNTKTIETYEYLPPFLDGLFNFIGSKFSLAKMKKFKHIIKIIERDSISLVVLIPEPDYWFYLYFKDNILFAFISGSEQYLLPLNLIPPRVLDRVVEILSKCKINDNYH